jgi:hypothetical protein
MSFDKEDINKINDTLDKHTQILSDMKFEVAQEISLLKLAQQKMKYMIVISCITIPLSAGGDSQIIKLLKALF